MILVEDAIHRARLTVKMPATLILLALVGQALLLYPSGLLPQALGFVSLALAVLAWPLSVLYSLIAVPKWKLWAYPQVGNPPHLHEMAVAMKLIPPPGSALEKLEISAPAQKRRILSFEGRLS